MNFSEPTLGRRPLEASASAPCGSDAHTLTPGEARTVHPPGDEAGWYRFGWQESTAGCCGGRHGRTVSFGWEDGRTATRKEGQVNGGAEDGRGEVQGRLSVLAERWHTYALLPTKFIRTHGVYSLSAYALGAFAPLLRRLSAAAYASIRLCVATYSSTRITPAHAEQ